MNQPRVFPVTDPDLDAPDGAEVDGYQRVGNEWVLMKRDEREVAERTKTRTP